MIALLLWPNLAIAQDKWFAADKAKHFGAGAAISGGGYVAAMPLTERTRWRITIGTTAGVAAAVGKELRDRASCSNRERLVAQRATVCMTARAT